MWLAWLITFNVVCLAWVFFRSPDLSTAFAMLGGLFSGDPSPLVTLPVVFLTAAAIGLQAVPGRFWEQAEGWLVTRPVAAQGVALGLPDRGRGCGRRPGGGCPSSTSSSEPWTVHPEKTSPCPPAACSA